MQCLFGSESRHANYSRGGNKTSQGQNKIMSRSYVASNSSVCPIYSENHKVHECKLFLNMSIANRNMEIKRKRLYVKYLKQKLQDFPIANYVKTSTTRCCTNQSSRQETQITMKQRYHIAILLFQTPLRVMMQSKLPLLPTQVRHR